MGENDLSKLYTALIALSMIWGASFLFIKILVEEFGSIGVVFLRCSFGAVTLLFILFVKKELIRDQQLPWKSLIIVSLLNNFIPWGLIALSETKITSSLASVVNASTPIWTSIIGFAFFSIRLKKFQWLGVLIGFIGILFLLQLDITKLFSESLIGVGTMTLAAISYGLSSQYTKRYLSNVSVFILGAFTLSFSAIISFFVTLFINPLSLERIFSYDMIFPIIGLGVFGSGIAMAIFFYLVREGSAEFASFVTYLVPVTALLWGSLFLNETITLNMIFGLILIFIGVFLSTYKRRNSMTVKQAKLNKSRSE